MLGTFKLDEYSIVRLLEYQAMTSHRYAIIEPSLFDDLLVYVYQQNPVLEWDYLLGHELKARSPIIIKLTGNESHDDFLNRFIAQPSGSLFSSSLDFKAFQQQALYSYNIVKGSGNKATLRFYDPRVILSLIIALTEEQKTQWLNGIDTIQWYQNGHWYRYQYRHSSLAIEFNHDNSIVITNKQLALMDDVRKWQIVDELSTQYQPFIPEPYQAINILLDAEKYFPLMAQDYESYLRMRMDVGCLEKEPQWMSVKLSEAELPLSTRIKEIHKQVKSKEVTL